MKKSVSFGSALIAIALSASSFGQTTAPDCWLCLTEWEARTAADSALWGQHSARMAARYAAMYELRSEEAAALRVALAKCDSAGLASRREADNWRRAGELMAKERKRTWWKNAGRTVLIGAGALGVGYGVGRVWP